MKAKIFKRCIIMKLQETIKEEYEERVKIILKKFKIEPEKFKIRVKFYKEKHPFCPLGFDIDIKNNKIYFDVCSAEEEEPSMFWETVEEELESMLGGREI